MVYDSCFMARLSPTKGVFDIPKIWEEVVSENNEAKLLIIGNGLEKDERKIRLSIRQCNIEQQIDMVGLKTGSEKYRLMKSCKIFVFPSYEEGFAISILEAMACKLPVVAWDLPVYKLIYKDAIIKVPVGNNEIFARKVLELLGDYGLRLSYAQRGYELSRNFDWDVIARKSYEWINN